MILQVTWMEFDTHHIELTLHIRQSTSAWTHSTQGKGSV